MAITTALLFSSFSETPVLAQGGMVPEGRALIQNLSPQERRAFKRLSRPERREFIQNLLQENNKQTGESTPAPPADTGARLSPRSPRARQIEAGLFNTGVQARYPEGHSCLEVKSFFGDQTRFDGSQRTTRFYQGYHEGMDISADEGTPLIALADGEVVHKFSGGRLVGNQIYLRHTPDDTGLPVFIYSKYKHFAELPDLKIGERVKMGQVIGQSGKTGTQGGHFGRDGYPHLHLSVYVTTSPDYQSEEKRIKSKGLRYLDPLALYLMSDGKVYDNHRIKALPDDQKSVTIPFKAKDGTIHPAGTRFVWPFVC